MNAQQNPVRGSTSLGIKDFLLFFVWLALATGIVFVATPSVNQATQTKMAGIVLGLLLLLSFFRKSDVGRILFLSLAGFLVLRYFIWRTFTTLSYHDALSFSFSIILYLAEVYGIALFFLGAFVNVRPFKRQPVPLPEDRSIWPSVDVYVPSYNESKDILETTLIAALQMQYPADRFKVYLLDDGGTDAKCSQMDIAKRATALARRDDMKELCKSIGATYLTRAENDHAKAGNINAAFINTDGELLLILDADHVPTQDFLQNTVGSFLVDPGLFMVQTPHFAVTPDPIERNLKTFNFMPSEQEMFYSGVQHGLDHWNASSFCGSAALLRRTCLEEIGGILGKTITEDAETALELHSRGYSSEYVGRPMVAGLAPPTVEAFITQRSRWAQGMLQVMMLSRPLTKRGLSLPQRLCYMNSCLFWLFPLVRSVYTLAPWAFLVFGMKIYTTNWQSFLVFAVPYVVAVMTTSNYLHGKVRWPFVSDIYEIVQAVHLIPPVLQALFRPLSGIFKVTPKSETLDKDFISSCGWPVQLLFIINLIAIGGGTYRVLTSPEDFYPASITLYWALTNCFILAGALGAITERRQDSDGVVVPIGCGGNLQGFGNEQAFACELKEMEIGCCRLEIPYRFGTNLRPGQVGKLHVSGKDNVVEELTIRFQGMRPSAFRSDESLFEFEFAPASIAETKAKVSLMFGDSRRWVDFQAGRQKKLSLIVGAVVVGALALKGLMHHLRVLLRSSNQKESSSSEQVGSLALNSDLNPPSQT